jgi:hypothetical protein
LADQESDAVGAAVEDIPAVVELIGGINEPAAATAAAALAAIETPEAAPSAVPAAAAAANTPTDDAERDDSLTVDDAQLEDNPVESVQIESQNGPLQV